MLIDGQVGNRSGISVIDVELVVRAVLDGTIGQINRTAPDLDAVIITPLDGDILNRGAATDADHGQTVDLLVLFHGDAGVQNLYITQNTGIIVGIGIAGHKRGITLIRLDLFIARDNTDIGRITDDGQPAPLARCFGAAVICCFRGEDNGLGGRTVGNDL